MLAHLVAGTLALCWLVMEGALRERLRAGRGVGGGDHHAAGPRQHDLPVGHNPQHRRVLRLDRPHQAEAGEEKRAHAKRYIAKGEVHCCARNAVVG